MPESRRRRHAGHIRKRDSGNWQAIFTDPATGKQRSLGTFKTYGDASRAYNTYETRRRQGEWTDPRDGKRLFREAADRWLTSCSSLAESTLARHRSILRSHILPAIGDRQLASLRKIDVQDLINDWRSKCAPLTVRRMYTTLRCVFSYAEDAGWLTKSPCSRTSLPPAKAARSV